MGPGRLDIPKSTLIWERMASLNKMIAKILNGVVHRMCSSYVDGYKDVYYKRTGAVVQVREASGGWVQVAGKGSLKDLLPMSAFSFLVSF